jgi:crotonobetainyl-CoA:carnitine CoA-transferase CaiB-like acyl-CoA transferase
MAGEASNAAAQRTPLQGVRVLDLSNVLAGPLASYALALLGAEVIKVERPVTGDLARKMGSSPELGKALMGASYLSTNANKKSITLNLQSTKGREILLKLVETTDVLLENFRPGTMERLGIGYEKLKARNTKLVYCAVSGFGQQGPLAQRAAYDQIIQGFCGLMSLTGAPDDGPTRAGFTVCDGTSAITAALAMLAALYRARDTGVGTMIDLSMLDTSLMLASWIVSNFVNAGAIPHPMGNQNHSAAPSGAFPTKEGLLNLVCNEDKQFEAFCDAIGRSDLKTHAVWGNRFERLKKREELHDIIKPILMQRTAAEWEEYFAKHGVPSGRIYSVPEIVQHPQVVKRGFVKQLDDVPGIPNGIKVPGLGFKFVGEDMSPKTPPPRLGQDTESVLGSIGYDAQQIAALRADRII